MSNTETYSETLEADLTEWLVSRDESLFSDKIYLPLLNYTAGCLLRIYPTASQDDALTYLADVVARLPKYDAGKGCTVLSFVRHNVQWIYGEYITKQVADGKKVKFQTIYNQDGKVDESVCGVDNPDTTLEDDEEYHRLVNMLEVSIANGRFTQRKINTRQSRFERDLICALRNKGKNQYRYKGAMNSRDFGIDFSSKYTARQVISGLIHIRKKVRRSKEKTRPVLGRA